MWTESTSDAIHVVDLQGRVQQVNPAFVAMFDWTQEEVRGCVLQNCPEQLKLELQEQNVIMMSGGSIANHETVRYTKSGEPLVVSITLSSIRDEREQVIAIATISRNMTVRKQSEQGQGASAEDRSIYHPEDKGGS